MYKHSEKFEVTPAYHRAGVFLRDKKVYVAIRQESDIYFLLIVSLYTFLRFLFYHYLMRRGYHATYLTGTAGNKKSTR
ncbi:hypothetical protein AMI01nite_18570 [Aneurinibacillus migulanus]|nr:hypothetical protein AMI01nite_18570 [Aneurinibacillus migulanus]